MSATPHAVYQRDLYHARKAAGLCTRCGLVEVTGASRCAPCAKVIAQAAAKRRGRQAATPDLMAFVKEVGGT